MQVCAGGISPFTRRVAKQVALPQISAHSGSPICVDVQIQKRPTCLLDTVTIQILNHDTVSGAHNQAIRGGHNGGLAFIAAKFLTGRSKIYARVS